MFSHVETWIFDLDNTLYHPSARLFDQINLRMTGFIMRELRVSRAEANGLRRRYWQRHGTTLRGLIDNHGVEDVIVNPLGDDDSIIIDDLFTTELVNVSIVAGGGNGATRFASRIASADC